MTISNQQLVELGASEIDAKKIMALLQEKATTPEACWESLKKEILCRHYPSSYSFPLHKLLFSTLFPEWNHLPCPAFAPGNDFIQTTIIAELMREKKCNTYQDLHHWSVQHYSDFWQTMLDFLQINMSQPFSQLLDLSKGVASPLWFKDAQFNITQSCFAAHKNKTAIISQNENGKITQISYEALDKLSNRVANSLSGLLPKGARIGIMMPMTIEAVAIYLGIIKAGCVIVSIADSFATDEIAKRFQIANVRAVFTQDKIIRDGKTHALYEKVIEAHAPLTIVLAVENPKTSNIRQNDILWDNFLSEKESYQAIPCAPDDAINILFSSGTTGDPKAIPWTQTTPIKCASDAALHLNVTSNDIFCWPSNLGWMMGPWLIFACLINKATLALYAGTPNDRRFGQFIQDTKVTLLGVVPTIVKTWHYSKCMEGLNWGELKLFASTGEASNVEDMLYLMYLVNYKPIIEYCGGTEIGGAYITSTLLHPCAPSMCTTPALGLDFVVLDESGNPADTGEVAIIGPSIGLSTELLNKDHFQVYYANMPTLDGKVLRRHGDEIKRFANGYYRMLGRVDDTMKLSGIKVSATEIESVLNGLPEVHETAAVAVQPTGGGPSELIIYVVLSSQQSDLEQLKITMQNAIKHHLNPLFKIKEVIKIDALPRTASNKIIRRALKKD